MALEHIEVILERFNMEKILDNALSAGTLEMAINAVKEAKSAQQPDTGRLRNSIMYKTIDKKGGFNDNPGKEQAPDEIDANARSEKEAVVGFNLNYGIYQEFGTKHMAPQPFLRPAIALTKGSDKKDVIKAINDEVERGTLTETKIRETFGL